MRWPLVWRSTHEAVCAERDRLREELADTVDERDNFRESAEKLAVEAAGLRGALKRIAGYNRALNAQSREERKRSGFDDGRARMTAARVKRHLDGAERGKADASKSPVAGPRADVQDGGAS